MALAPAAAHRCRAEASLRQARRSRTRRREETASGDEGRHLTPAPNDLMTRPDLSGGAGPFIASGQSQEPFWRLIFTTWNEGTVVLPPA